MNQHELNREVARATGESVETIEALGFSVLTLSPPWVVVDHRVRLSDLTRQKMRRHLKTREVPARKPKPTVKKVSPGGGGSGGSRRRAARAPECFDQIMPMPRITKLTFDPWRA